MKTHDAWLPPGHDRSRFLFFICPAIVVGLTIMRGISAAGIELRVDEAYYWTWSKENVLSYLDHPPMIAWGVRLGTFLFGDTSFGVRFTGLLAMLLMQVLLADIVWRTVRDARYTVLAVLMPEASPCYGFLMAKVAPDTALIPFALGVAWALVRLAQSGNQRWWLLAGVFGGLALLSKYSAILLLPAVVAYALAPAWRSKHLCSPYFWLAALIAAAIFSPVIYWNAIHDWVSFRFQLDRPSQIDGWSARFMLEFIGQQFVLVGPILFPVVMIGATMFGRRGCRERDPVSILLATCVLLPVALLLWRSLSTRIGDSWPLFVWPFGFACAAINLELWTGEAPTSPLARAAPRFAVASIVTGIGVVLVAMTYYLFGQANYLKNVDPIGKEAGFGPVAEAAQREAKSVGASWFATTDYRIYSMLRWHLKDQLPVVQVNERSRFIDLEPSANLNAGSVGLYVTPDDHVSDPLWRTTTAVLEPVGQVDLTWRGFRYDTYVMEKLTNWQPVLSPPAGDVFYVAAPH